MILLAADTATSYLTIAVCDAHHVLAESTVQCGRAHSERLVESARAVLDQCGHTLESIDALAISIGPGSFTGVRVGVATWKGLAFGARKPLVGVPTLDAMTRLSSFQNATVCPLLDARMHEVFGAVYRYRDGVREKLAPDRVCPVEMLLDETDASTVFLGDGAALYRERILLRHPNAVFAAPPCDRPRGAAVAFEAMAMLEAGACSDPALVTPVYLRQSQAEINLANKLAAANAAAAP